MTKNNNEIRSPNWHENEIILALDLYRQDDLGAITKNSDKVIELSNLLNKLTIHPKSVRSSTFRNPNGVALKLANLMYVDPNAKGGMTGASKKDREVLLKYEGKLDKLRLDAKKIKDSILYNDSDTQDGDEYYSAKEGKVTYRSHKTRERDSRINKIKKEQYFAKYKKLDCEVCGFDFCEKYGSLGDSFIETHHIIPLSQLKEEQETILDDLALVCSNCHRMLHRKKDVLDIEELKIIVKTTTNS